MNRLKAEFFIFACWLAAKAIKMRVNQMKAEGVFVNPTYPMRCYATEVLNVDFGEVVLEMIGEE